MSLYNMKNPAVKRLMREAEELRNPTEEYYAQPLEDNLFEWHFTLRGPPNSEFEGGIYHGRISLPSDYPMKPPSIILLTPNGRFEVNKKICLSISGHHPESWQPSWSIRTALLAMVGFLPTHGNGAIGSLDYTAEERKNLAIRSQTWQCPECGCVKDFLKITNTNDHYEMETEIQSADTLMQSAHLMEESGPSEDIKKEPSNIVQEIENGECQSSVEEENNQLKCMDKLAANITIPATTEISNNQDITSAIRHRPVVSNETPMIPAASNEEGPMNHDAVLPALTWSSVVIWIISLILISLIVRRWLYFEYL